MSKTVIITGASSGIGLAIAKHFIEKGDKVIMNANNPERLKAAYESLGSPQNATYLSGDISKAETGKSLVVLALEKYSRVDVLINNAGVFLPKPFLDVEEADLDRFWSVNLKGTYFTTQAVVPQMIAQNNGTIINIGTVLVDHAIAGFPASAAVASKGGVHALTKQLAAEFGGNNIKVNTIAPGIIRSPLQGKIGVSNADDLAGLHLLNRVGEASEIAEMTYHLANSNFITGEVINVDGGHVAGHAFN
ncbi:SDR family NAD(P)-dependent oxidoreductase [uncultured Flavobacterium sp.]|mgnify:CR=1 FL=1|uniref:SDR family NAD(P)-dependent oxidoreductase n=1 Tax=uncultured Flavobacterium sp. TaxID=165435 RepID=UPI0025D5F5DE|nr:SDR family oxidoreductase [uncultured Flavobacterium sp.]